MKNILNILTLAVVILLSACQKNVYIEPAQALNDDFPENPNHPMRDSIKAIVEKHLGRGVPGAQVIVKNGDGWCVVNGGFAKIEDQTPMSTNMTAWLYSITKVYTATLVMSLKEQGLIDLDTTIRAYLPATLTDHLDKSERITVRMLLNHSSGLVNFTTTPAYFLTQFNEPTQQPSPDEQLKFIYDKKTLFEPGSDFSYSNTNYLLLQYILEKLSGKRYETLLKSIILEPLGLVHTYYPATDAQIFSLGFPNYYFERYNNGQLENCTRWHNAISKSLGGYGGIAANGADVILFYGALLHGQIVSQESLQEMKEWIQGKESTEPDYGLGLEYYEYIKGTPTFGHEGDNIGGTTQILYVPATDTYIFITLNAGRQLYGSYLFKTSDLKIDLCRYVSKHG